MSEQKQQNIEEEIIEAKEVEKAEQLKAEDDHYHWPKELLSLLKWLLLISLLLTIILGFAMGVIQKQWKEFQYERVKKNYAEIIEQHFLDNYGIEVEVIDAEESNAYIRSMSVVAAYGEERIHSTIYNSNEIIFDDYNVYQHKQQVIQYVVESLGLPEPQSTDILRTDGFSLFDCFCMIRIPDYQQEKQRTAFGEGWNAVDEFERNKKIYRFFYDGEVALPDDLSQRLADLFLPLQEKKDSEREDPAAIEFIFLTKGSMEQIIEFSEEAYLPCAQSIIRYEDDGKYLPKEIVE